MVKLSPIAEKRLQLWIAIRNSTEPKLLNEVFHYPEYTIDLEEVALSIRWRIGVYPR